LKKECNKRRIFIEKGLDENRFNEISNLIKVCDDYDSTGLSQVRPILLPKDESCQYLLSYEEDDLKGYLGIFPSAIKEEVKMVGMVHPSFRRKGIFTALFNRGRELCLNQDVSRIVLINNKESNSGKGFAEYIGAEYIYSTYGMGFNSENHKLETLVSNRVLLRLANSEDVKDMVRIGTQAFGTTEEDELEYNEGNMSRDYINTYIGFYNDEAIGMISVVTHNNKTTICDLAVLRNQQGKGYGREILVGAINQIIDQGIKHISLVVETKNKNALYLYEICGFRIDYVNDYYQLLTS